MYTLEGQGEKVNWPPGMDSATAYRAIIDFFAPMISNHGTLTEELDRTALSNEAVAAPNPSASSTGPPETISEELATRLSDLLFVIEIGEPVIWPPGWDEISARATLSRPR